MPSSGEGVWESIMLAYGWLGMVWDMEYVQGVGDTRGPSIDPPSGPSPREAARRLLRRRQKKTQTIRRSRKVPPIAPPIMGPTLDLYNAVGAPCKVGAGEEVDRGPDVDVFALEIEEVGVAIAEAVFCMPDRSSSTSDAGSGFRSPAQYDAYSNVTKISMLIPVQPITHHSRCLSSFEYLTMEGPGKPRIGSSSVEPCNTDFGSCRWLTQGKSEPAGHSVTLKTILDGHSRPAQ